MTVILRYIAVVVCVVFLFSERQVAAEEAKLETKTTSVHEQIRRESANAELRMQFHGTTKSDAETWTAAFGTQLKKLLGDTTPPQKWTQTEVSRTVFPEFVRYELLLHATGFSDLPVYLLIPKSASKARPAPAVLCTHGHGDFGHHPIVGRTDAPGYEEAKIEASIVRANYNYGLQFVKRGYIVAAPCMIPFGDRKKSSYGSDPCAVTFVRMMALGKLPLAENLRALRWSISLLQSLPETKSEKIGAAGLSYGGRMTMMVTATDQRVKVAAVSGALNLLQERITNAYSCGSQIIPGLLQYGDYSEIGSLIAPRPCVWEVGSKDGLVIPKWDELFKARLQKIYAASGAGDQLKFDHFEGGHRWNGEVAFPLFDRVLKSPR